MQKHLDESDHYTVDEFFRILPVNSWGWILQPWKDCITFEDAIKGITPVTLEDCFPEDSWTTLSSMSLEELNAQRHMSIEDGFYLATGVDIRCGLRQFQWKDNVFFNIRPDYGFLLLSTDCDAGCANSLELEIRNQFLDGDYHLPCKAITQAIKANEINPAEYYPIEWWVSFWKIRGISLNDTAPTNKSYSQESKIIGAIALCLAEKTSKYKLGDKPNANAIAGDVSELLDALPDVQKYGVGNTKIRTAISNGIKALTGPKSKSDN